MGKGLGSCISSKPSSPAPPVKPVLTPTPVIKPTPVAVTEAKKEPVEKMVKIYIIYYSMYGHLYTLAKKIKEGVDSVEGCQAELFQVAETLPAEVLEKMHAPPKPDVPVIDAHTLPEADGFLFGMPSRFGMMATQMKAFFDSTGQHWFTGALVGKPAGLFVSTATQNGGQETTMFTAVTQLAHHGMIFVPVGGSAGPTTGQLDEVMGGGNFGSGTIAGTDGSRQPSEIELKHAFHQGKYFAGKAKLLAAK